MVWRLVCVCAVAAGAFAVVAASSEPAEKGLAPKKDPRLVGRWDVVAGDEDGNPTDKYNRLRWTFGEDNVLTVEVRDEKVEPRVAVYEVTVLAKEGRAGEFVFTPKNGENAGRPLQAIYQFSGADGLRVCHCAHPLDGKRLAPKEFKTTRDSGLVAMEFKKAGR